MTNDELKLFHELLDVISGVSSISRGPYKSWIEIYNRWRINADKLVL